MTSRLWCYRQIDLSRRGTLAHGPVGSDVKLYSLLATGLTKEMHTCFAHVEEALTHLHGEAPHEGMAAVQFNMGATEAALDRYEDAEALPSAP